MELAFLNCCDTGDGKLYAGGLVGLARAFFIAGAQQVVVYRGPLPDKETTIRFAGWFYEEYFKTRRADVALASAQRNAFKEEFPEQFWANYYVLNR